MKTTIAKVIRITEGNNAGLYLRNAAYFHLLVADKNAALVFTSDSADSALQWVCNRLTGHGIKHEIIDVSGGLL